MDAGLLLASKAGSRRCGVNCPEQEDEHQRGYAQYSDYLRVMIVHIGLHIRCHRHPLALIRYPFVEFKLWKSCGFHFPCGKKDSTLQKLNAISASANLFEGRPVSYRDAKRSAECLLLTQSGRSA